jgi:hypothetical protein
MNSLDYTKTDGKYYKDNPERQRIRNRLRPIYYKLAGGLDNYYASSENERQRLRTAARKELRSEELEDLIYNIAPPRNWTRTKRKLPKINRPKSVRITTKKIVDSRGYVYIFKDHMKSDDLYKIGASHAPQERLDQANTWGDFESIYESEEVADCAKIEKEVHQFLRKWNVKGEWFNIPEVLAINKTKEIVNESFNYAVAS